MVRRPSALLKFISILSFSLLVAGQAQALRVATYNIRNFDYDTRSQVPTDKNELAEILIGLQADLIAVQEITKPDVFESFLAQHLPDHKMILSKCGGAHGQHLGLVYNQYKIQVLKSFEDERTTMTSKKPGQACSTEGSRPMMIARMRDIQGQLGLFTAVVVHLKAGGDGKSQDKRKHQYDEIVTALGQLRTQGEKSLMVMGDFNTTEYSASAEGKRQFLQTFKRAQMEDLGEQSVACSNYYFNRESSAKTGELTASVLDHILVGQDIMQNRKVTQAQAQAHCQVHQCEARKAQDLGASYEGVSDHCPLLTEIQ